MRKYIALVLTLVCVLALVGCEKNDTYMGFGARKINCLACRHSSWLER